MAAPFLLRRQPSQRVHPRERDTMLEHPTGSALLDSQPDVRRRGPQAATAGVLAREHVLPTTLAYRQGFYLRYGKRLFDLAACTLGMIVVGPVMLVLGILIKLDSPGPMFYRSRRTGLGGRLFTFYKLRSMHVGAHLRRSELWHLNEADGPIFKVRKDPRVTRIGRWLRHTSLDELPQLLNVLKGDMSLVGPRPPLPEEVEHYEPWQLRRLDVKPGITCLWQISGRSRLGFDEWMRLDLEYIRHRSLALDLKILVRTIPAVLSREGAY
ncbi:MAG: sugar transferase [Candidatus Eisenbacteria bacterium]|nr:sugar transferase [Candidatus Eisenbacteria bacterium]